MSDILIGLKTRKSSSTDHGMMRICVALCITLAHAFVPKTVNRISRMDKGFIEEAEFKHARVAMTALPALAALSASGVDEPVKWLSQQPIDVQLTFFGTAGVIEAASLARLGPRFSLKEDRVPGNVLGFSNISTSLINSELYVGRAAMLGAACAFVSAL